LLVVSKHIIFCDVYRMLLLLSAIVPCVCWLFKMWRRNFFESFWS